MKNIPLVECWNFVGATPQKFDGEKRYISTGALDKDHINEADVEMVTFDNRPSRANLEVNSGDILFAKMASTEKTFVVDSISQNDIYSTGFCAVRANESKILSKCLYYFLSSSLFLEQKDKNSSGATQKAITNAGLSKIYINLPELAEQQEFIEQMDSLTSLITARREQLAKLDELVKSRFVELFECKGFPNATIGELVVSKVSPVKKVFSSSDTIKYIDISSIDNKRNIMTGFTEYVLADAPSRAQQHIRKGDIVVSTVRPNLKNVAITGYDYDNLVASSGFCVLRAEKCLPSYLMAVVCSDDFTDAMTRVVTGANYPAIKDSDVRNYVAPNPPIELQEQFATFVEQTDKSKLAVQQSLEKLETLKKALMQKYFG